MLLVTLIALYITGCFEEKPSTTTNNGFTSENLRIPDIGNATPGDFIHTDKEPDFNNTPHGGILNFSLSWFFFTNTFYTYYGQTLSISFNNNMNNRIFVYSLSIETSYGVTADKELGVYIESYVDANPLGLIHLTGPRSEGNFTYNVSISFYIHSDGSWHDVGEQIFDGNIFYATKLPVFDSTKSDLVLDSKTEGLLVGTRIQNKDPYYSSVNSVYDPNDATVRSKSVALAAAHPGSYNIWQILEIFEFVKDNISYVSDPRAITNYWASPNETLAVQGGDCEDKAILLGAMISSIGGSCRIYLTDEHAFCTIYVGPYSSVKKEISQSLETYHQASLPPFFLRDDDGYWLVADPTGSLYLGGYPLGSHPVQFGIVEVDTWSWLFSSDTDINIVDLVGSV